MPDTKAIVFGLVLGVSLSVASLVAVILSNEPASASAKAFLLGDKHRNKHRKRNNRHQHHDRHSQQPRALDDDDECQDGGRAQARELSARCGDGVASLIGNTPLFRIQSLSDATGCEIMAKAEFLNVGGSTKDRVALSIITEAEKRGLIVPHRGDTIFEGTVGSTGISLAVIAKAKGYNCHIVMPDDIAKEKYELLEKLGAVVEKVRQVPIVHKDHFVNVAKRRAAEMNARADEMDTQLGMEQGTDGTSDESVTDDEDDVVATSPIGSPLRLRRKGDRVGHAPRGFFADQFENLSNFNIHYRTTGPEIYAQTGGSLDAVVLGAGTGGTLAGITHYLKPLLPDMLAVLADPHGSGLYHKVKHGIMYSPTEAEGTRKRHQVDTVVEGVGINRLTKNFQKVADGWLDEAVKVSDREAVEMARYLVRNDGLFVGSSSAVNCVAAVRVARQLGPGHTIVTMINDHGTRHLTKFWNDEYIANAGLTPHATGLEFLDEPHPYAAASSLASSRSSSTSNLNTVSNVDQTPPPTSGIPSLLETEQAAFLALSKPPNNTASIINTLASAPSSVYAWSRTRFQKAAVNFIRNSGPIPQHVGFIMDGNRRYAKKVGARPGVGHVAGSRKLEETLEWCLNLGITSVTVYAFSIENFKRPAPEVDLLMELATAQLEQFALNTDFVHQNGIRVNVLGNTSLLPPHVLSATLKAEEATRGNTRVVLNICCPYTSRHEMAEAVNRAVGEVQGGNLGVEEISESVLDGFMGTGGQPDLDILVRTSGEKRLSDFLLWQVSKPCQIRFVDVLWPEFTFWDMVPILLAYQAHYPEMVKERAALAAQNQTSTSNGGKVVVGDAVAKTAKSIRDPRDPAIVVHNPGRVEKQRRMGSAGH